MNDEEFLQIVEKSKTMAEAAKLCGMSFKRFITKAKRLGCYNPNPGGAGTKKPRFTLKERRNFVDEILDGKHPQYQTYKLKILLFKFELLVDKCYSCGWNEKAEGALTTPCELHHIDGNSLNHSLENLTILCPNCHSLTKTYRFRRGKTNEHLGRKLLSE